jgi:hypothetical protein
MHSASVRLKQNCRASETTEVRQEACSFFCKEADQQTERDEQEDLEGSRNSLAESAGKPVACEGDLSQLKIWVKTS